MRQVSWNDAYFPLPHTPQSAEPWLKSIAELQNMIWQSQRRCWLSCNLSQQMTASNTSVAMRIQVPAWAVGGWHTIIAFGRNTSSVFTLSCADPTMAFTFSAGAGGWVAGQFQVSGSSTNPSATLNVTIPNNPSAKPDNLPVWIGIYESPKPL